MRANEAELMHFESDKGCDGLGLEADEASGAWAADRLKLSSMEHVCFGRRCGVLGLVELAFPFKVSFYKRIIVVSD